MKWDSKLGYTTAKIDAEPCNIFKDEADKQKTIVEDLNFVDGTIFIIETPTKTGNEYVFKPMNEVEEEKAAFQETEEIISATFDMEKMLKADLGK